MPLITFSWFLCTLYLVRGISDGGQCPSVQPSTPSSTFDLKETFHSLFQTIHQFEKPHPFKDLPKDFNENSHTYIFPNHSGYPCLLITSSEDHRLGMIPIVLTGTPPGSAAYQDAMAPLECNNVKMEVVRVWYDSDQLFLWSCIETASISQHHQSLIILASNSLFRLLIRERHDLRMVTGVILETVMKYVGKVFEGQIIIHWQSIFLENNTTNTKASYDHQEEPSSWQFLAMSVTLVSAVFVLWALLLNLKDI